MPPPSKLRPPPPPGDHTSGQVYHLRLFALSSSECLLHVILKDNFRRRFYCCRGTVRNGGMAGSSPHQPASLLVSRRRWQRQEQKQINDPQLQPGSPPQPRPASRPPPVSKQFQTFCTSKAEIVHDFSRRQKRLSGGGEEAEECLFTNKGSWRQKGARSPPQSLLLALQS